MAAKCNTNRYFQKAFTCLLATNVFFVVVATAQDSITKRPAYLYAAFLADFPESYGLSAGVAAPFASVLKKNVGNGSITSKQKDYFVSLSSGFYRYPYNYTGLYFYPALGVHVNKNQSPAYHELAVGVGLLRTFYDGKVYEIDPSGNIKELPFFGRYYATANFSYTVGWQLQKHGLKQFDIMVKPSFWFQFPFNSFIKPHISMEAGVRYHFRDVSLRTRIRVKTKNE